MRVWPDDFQDLIEHQGRAFDVADRRSRPRAHRDVLLGLVFIQRPDAGGVHPRPRVFGLDLRRLAGAVPFSGGAGLPLR